MRDYLRRRRLDSPALALWDRAKSRARRRGVDFSISRDVVEIPEVCPVLGVPLSVGDARSGNSPSLDRIRPDRGYIPHNVRVISDRANRLKGACCRSELEARAVAGRKELREDYAKVVAYVDREALLVEVRLRAKAGGRMGAEWAKIADFLDRAFQKGPT